MARSRKANDKQDAETLVKLRKLLAEAMHLSIQFSMQVCSANAILIRHGIEVAQENARMAHESAHFGATGELLSKEEEE